MTMWQRLDDWVGTPVDDALVMIHLESGRYVSLNYTAAEAWDALQTPQNEDGIVKALTERFTIDEAACRNSVGPLLERMRDMGLVAAVA